MSSLRLSGITAADTSIILIYARYSSNVVWRLHRLYHIIKISTDSRDEIKRRSFIVASPSTSTHCCTSTSIFFLYQGHTAATLPSTSHTGSRFHYIQSKAAAVRRRLFLSCSVALLRVKLSGCGPTRACVHDTSTRLTWYERVAASVLKSLMMSAGERSHTQETTEATTPITRIAKGSGSASVLALRRRLVCDSSNIEVVKTVLPPAVAEGELCGYLSMPSLHLLSLQ